jgi:hypothetical protein
MSSSFLKTNKIFNFLGLLDLTLEKNNIELDKYGLQPTDLTFIKELIYGRFNQRNSVPKYTKYIKGDTGYAVSKCMSNLTIKYYSERPEVLQI